MSNGIVILGLVLFGLGLLTYVGFLVRQGRWRESVALLEVVIDRAVGVEPPARNGIDHVVMLVQLALMTCVGLIVTALGLFVILKDSGILE